MSSLSFLSFSLHLFVCLQKIKKKKKNLTKYTEHAIRYNYCFSRCHPCRIEIRIRPSSWCASCRIFWVKISKVLPVPARAAVKSSTHICMSREQKKRQTMTEWNNEIAFYEVMAPHKHTKKRVKNIQFPLVSKWKLEAHIESCNIIYHIAKLTSRTQHDFCGKLIINSIIFSVPHRRYATISLVAISVVCHSLIS